MNWTSILSNAGIPESPGRPEAVALAKEATRRRLQRKLESPTPASKKPNPRRSTRRKP